MKFFSLLLLFTLSFSLMAEAQTDLHFESMSEAPFTVLDKQANSLMVLFNVNKLSFNTFAIDNESFTELQIDGFGKTYEMGSPDLPQMVQLISVPKNTSLALNEPDYVEEFISLSEENISDLIKPAIASVSKSNDKKIVYKKGPAYFENRFIEQAPVELKEVGTMRDVKIYELVYHPFLYNAVTNELILRNNLHISLDWEDSNFDSQKWHFTNPVQAQKQLNQTQKSLNERDVFVIVSPTKFKETLLPFIKWKTKQGFQIIESYIGEELANNNKETIKAYLKDLYENPQEGMLAPSYILLIGDVSDIPAWNGKTDYHVTDLYYAEYTNDYLPELHYGRFSAASEGQLQTIINKTLFVEQGAGADGTFQNKHLLVSGVDSDYAPIYGNGAINYFLDYYSHQDLGIETSYYLYGSGSPIVSNNSQAKQAILNDFSDGVGIAYYTAHCSQYGWSNPEFEISDIASVNNVNKYPLMIGNCCESYKYNTNSFGEEIVRAEGKGAVAYIGASNYSYWDEDYYWGVGFTNNINANPTYEATGLGSWDAWFHTHNENTEDIANTAAEILKIGNLAVQASSSNLKNYYWEVYGIMGDPSLVPAKYRYSKMDLSFNEILTVGQSSLQIETSQGANVTLFENSNLIAYAQSNEMGLAMLNFNPLTQIGDAAIEICVTHPDYLPFIDSLRVIAPEGPFLVFESVHFKDENGNELSNIYHGQNVSAYYSIKNYGNEDASNITLTINSESSWIYPMENNQIFVDKIIVGESFTTESPIDVKIFNNIPDQEKISFKGTITYQSDNQVDFEYILQVNAPLVMHSELTIDEQGIGNLDGVIDWNEAVSLEVSFINFGHAQVTNTTVQWSSADTSLFQVLSGNSILGGFDLNQENITQIDVQGGSDFFPGAQVQLNYVVTAGDDKQFQFNGSIPIILGHEPAYLMSNGKAEIISGYFYDSGGPDGKYENLEKYSFTFTPHIEGQGLMVEFLEFDVEASGTGCWDKLHIFNGDSINAPLIGVYCNFNSVNTVQSNNASGALTFLFESDNSTTKNGWKAHLSSSSMNSVKFIVTNGVDGVDGAAVELNNVTDSTDINGQVQFDHVLVTGEKSYKISKPGYFDKIGKLKDIIGDTTVTILLEALPDICFTVHNGIETLESVKITFDNRSLYTDSNGVVTFVDVIPGSKSYYVSKEGYVDTTGTLVVGKIDICLNVALRQKPTFNAQIIVSDEYGYVANASVMLGNDTVLTNEQGSSLFIGKYEGNYPLVVEKDGYIRLSSGITITDTNIVKELVLKLKTYGVYFTVNSHEQAMAGATISLMGVNLTTSYYGKAFLNGIVPANEIPFTVSKSGYHSYDGTFDIISDDVAIEVDLTPVGIYTKQNKNLSIYPNPVTKAKALTIAAANEIQQLLLFNYAGVLLINKTGLSNTFILNVSDINTGIYILQLKVNEDWFFEKVIIE